MVDMYEVRRKRTVDLEKGHPAASTGVPVLCNAGGSGSWISLIGIDEHGVGTTLEKRTVFGRKLPRKHSNTLSGPPSPLNFQGGSDIICY
jgi:hypothetical protein